MPSCRSLQVCSKIKLNRFSLIQPHQTIAGYHRTEPSSLFIVFPQLGVRVIFGTDIDRCGDLPGTGKQAGRNKHQPGSKKIHWPEPDIHALAHLMSIFDKHGRNQLKGQVSYHLDAIEQSYPGDTKL